MSAVFTHHSTLTYRTAHDVLCKFCFIAFQKISLKTGSRHGGHNHA